MLANIDRNCQRLNKLIGEILIMARFDSGRIQLELGDVDLVALASKQLESIGAVAGAKGVATDLVSDARHVMVTGDETRLAQLIDNLLSNAVKFTPPGGTVTIRLAADDGQVVLSVADDGAGIPAAEVDQVFDRFFRASTVGTTAGTGLGLSIAKSIVESHGGSIHAVSQLGAGTTFTIVLPLPVDAEARPTPQTHEVTT